ncbi:sodium/proline symporter [Zooshikella harenae]|uniref:Sodium/proline symporter n=1 Tax=Zooshikella harenae TaxID=2827238 RepID=A0ABS5ZDT1_9GAMM|nr:sodium/proline symporter [Zooshikella harenae]MBU2712223.1 sodium/proline symporter [Zooshikella harenae]
MVFSFLLFLGLFALIGVSSTLVSRGTKKDYYLASKSISPAFVGLSAVATNNSGYMFIGVIGYTYVTGLAAIWLMIGWIAGDYLASTFVHSRLRKATGQTDEVSFAGVLNHWHGRQAMLLQRVIALISFVFLLAYASAQLVAGSKALHVLLGWPVWAGASIGAFLVMFYCLSGGIRASIWTDVAQSVVMITAMAVMLVVATVSFGGPSQVIMEMSKVDGFLDWFPKDLALPGIMGGVLFGVSWAFAGLSVIGQPHIMVRFMTLSSATKMRQARHWYYTWFVAFYVMATIVGMISRIYLSDTNAFDAELALPTMALELLSPFMVGLVLAGIFAATISTADSLILSCSSALTHDLLPHNIENTWVLKITTGLITLLALMWAIFNQQTVFSLVIMAWSSLASAFAPLLICLCLGGNPKPRVSLFAIITGLSVALIWRYLGWHTVIYEGMPGILVGLIVLYSPLLLAFFQTTVVKLRYAIKP